jgi:Domain of unknown function (DUF4290)
MALKQPTKAPELGRYAEAYLAYAMSIQDKAERQQVVEKIVENLVKIGLPPKTTVETFRAKVWASLLEMSDNQLDVDIPANINTQKIDHAKTQLPYPNQMRRHRYYGRYVPEFIHKIEALAPEKQSEPIEHIGNYMKLAYKTWNNDFVADTTIAADFSQFADAKLEIPAETDLDQLIKNQRIVIIEPVKRGRKKKENS